MHGRPGILVSFVVLVWFGTIDTAFAQTPQRRTSIGAQVSWLRLTDGDSTSAGIGAHGSYQLWPWIDADAAFSFFPDDHFINDSTGGALPGFRLQYDRRRIELVAGPKIGIRRERVGVFGKVRPGFTRLFDQGLNCSGEVCAFALFVRPQYQTEFAMDLGGVVEVYPSPRVVARFDIGSTLIRHRSATPPCNGCTTNNLATSVGVGWKF